jgi:hypothetical protein
MEDSRQEMFDSSVLGKVQRIEKKFPRKFKKSLIIVQKTRIQSPSPPKRKISQNLCSRTLWKILIIPSIFYFLLASSFQSNNLVLLITMNPNVHSGVNFSTWFFYLFVGCLEKG